MSSQNKNTVSEINESFTRGDTEKFLSLCHEDVKWTIPGDASYAGKAAIREFMSSMEPCPPPQFSAIDLVEEGDVVMCHGDMTMQGPDGNEQDSAYCDVYRFAGGKVIELRSYIVSAKKGEN